MEYEQMMFEPLEENLEEEVVEVEEEISEPEIQEKTTGFVNCKMLNVRDRPEVGTDILAVLTEGTEINIDPSRSGVDWYYIKTPTGVYGYCMKQFID